MATKYKQYYKMMVEKNKELFDKFNNVLGKYNEDEILNQKEFHEIGIEVMDVVRDWDRRLCSAMGRGAFSQYSQRLSEKFWDEVRVDFPLIDKVGVKVKKKIV